MELTENSYPKSYGLSEEINLTAGQKLKVEVDENELDTAVPSGKKWNVSISVRVIETDA